MSKKELMKESYLQLVRRIRHYNEAVALLQWDLRTGMPRKGTSSRAAVIAQLSTEAFRLATSTEMEGYLHYFSEAGGVDGDDSTLAAMLRESQREFTRSRKIPQNRYQDFITLVSQSEVAWEEARQEADFAKFCPYLEKVVEFSREFADLWKKEGKSRYDALLDLYEPGMTTEQLDPVFSRLHRELVPFVQKVLDSSAGVNPATAVLDDYEIVKQQEANRWVLRLIGYDFAAGRLDESVHPFTVGFNSGDVRVTTRYDERDLRVALFSTLHEGGHALYEQNIDKELSGTPLWDGASLGIHESQSRFWENVIGRSRSFWQGQYAQLQQRFPEGLGNVTVEQFYKSINAVSRSLIRVEADELTYNLHIMLRYEIEKGLIDGHLQVAELPEIWREKMAEYIGAVPENDAEGVLQDVHWSDGSFGYFPTYTLGNIYAAQLTHTLRCQLPQFDELLGRGELHPIRAWMTDHVHRYGRLLSPDDVIRRATGESLNPDYLLKYLKDKYSELYSLA